MVDFVVAFDERVYRFEEGLVLLCFFDGFFKRSFFKILEEGGAPAGIRTRVGRYFNLFDIIVRWGRGMR